MAEWIQVCGKTDVELEGVIRFDHNGKTYAIYRSPDDMFFCTDGLCTHEAVHLADGLVFDHEIECPKHSGVFDYRSGEALRLPACKNLTVHQTRLVGDTVEILIG